MAHQRGEEAGEAAPHRSRQLHSSHVRPEEADQQAHIQGVGHLPGQSPHCFHQGRPLARRRRRQLQGQVPPGEHLPVGIDRPAQGKHRPQPHGPQGQGVVGGHHGVADGVGLGEVHHGGDILGPDLRDADGVAVHAAVAGQDVEGVDAGAFFQLPDDGVLPPAAADDHHIHQKNLTKRV